MLAARSTLTLAALVLLSPLRGAADTFACSEAGLLAAVAAGGGPHGFDCSAPTVVATSAEIVIASDLSIDGADLLTLDGGDHHRILSVAAGARVELRGLTLTRGNSATGTRWGGAIRNDGTLTLEDVSVTHSRATLRGAAIANTGTLTLRSSQVIQNGIPQPPSPAASVQGGIYSHAGRLVIEDSVIEDNLAGAGGGVLSLGALEISRSRIARNEPGGIEAAGETAIFDSTIADNRMGILCGGLSIGRAASATVLRTTVRDNRAGNACGGIGVAGKLVLMNSTVSGNQSALRRSGGLDVYDPLASVQVVNSTLVDNQGPEAGGVFVFQGHVVMRGSIVAGNHSAAGIECFTDPSQAQFESAGGNVFAGVGCPAGAGDYVVPAETVFGELLGPLAANGGPTDTHLPLAGSAALDVVPGLLCEAAVELPVGEDQRGLPRPSDGDRDGAARCDAGAVERVVEAVRIRIQPRVVPRAWRPRPYFPLRVLLFGSASVDVRDVALDSIAFGPDGAAPLRIPPPKLVDLRHDGDEELFLTFRLRDTGIGVGDTRACLTASLPSGVVIEGCDAIRVLPPLLPHGPPN